DGLADLDRRRRASAALPLRHHEHRRQRPARARGRVHAVGHRTESAAEHVRLHAASGRDADPVRQAERRADEGEEAMTRKILVVAIAAIAYFGQQDGRALDGRRAHAIIGRPLTPMSYAGVARRTARRTAYAGAAYGAAVAPVTALPAGCV